VFARTREREREGESYEENMRKRARMRARERYSELGITDEESTILIGRMRGWERMLVGGERDRV